MIANEEQARSYVAARCDPSAMERLDRFAAFLASENAKQNLVSPASLGAVWQRHIADSAQLLDLAPHTGDWLDLGTGAGFPGLVIAIMQPQRPMVLVESRRLRIEWLRRTIEELGLLQCSVAGARLESLETAPFGVISARAFAPLPRLVALAQRFSTSGTAWLLPKGRSAAQEVAELPKALRPMFHVEPSVTDPEAGIVVGRTEKDR